jgi:hypothetical protein
MEQFLGFGIVLLIGFVWLDNHLYSKSGFSLRNSLNINLYSDEWTKYERASYLFTKYPSQNKIDVMIKYGLHPKGTTQIPAPIGGPLGSYSYSWRKFFDEKGIEQEGSMMCHEIICLYKS